MKIDLLIALPITAVFGFLGGLAVFLATYIHFPKMEQRKRFMLSLKNAACLSLILIILVYLFLFLLFANG